MSAAVSDQRDGEVRLEIGPPDQGSGSSGMGRRWWWLPAVGLTLLLAGLAIWAWSRPSAEATESAAVAAQRSLERALPLVLSYDYRDLEKSELAAKRYFTTAYREQKFGPLWATVKANAPATQAVVSAEIVASAVASADRDQVVLVAFVDRPTQNKELAQELRFEDRVEVRMVKAGDDWLIADLATQ